jgi:hypothetical protein
MAFKLSIANDTAAKVDGKFPDAEVFERIVQVNLNDVDSVGAIVIGQWSSQEAYETGARALTLVQVDIGPDDVLVPAQLDPNTGVVTPATVKPGYKTLKAAFPDIFTEFRRTQYEMLALCIPRYAEAESTGVPDGQKPTFATVKDLLVAGGSPLKDDPRVKQIDDAKKA